MVNEIKKLFPLRLILSPSKGFSLVELLIVIAVMGVLSTFIVNTFSGSQERGRDAKRKTDLKAIQDALQLYYQDVGRYPLSGGGWVASTGGGVWIPGLDANYIRVIPTDPKNTCTAGNPETNTACLVYRYTSVTQTIGGNTCTFTNNNGYLLEARMENVNDTDRAVTQPVPCNSGSAGPVTGANRGVLIRTNP